MTYIDELLRNQGREIAIPFWKLHLKEDEVDSLVTYIKNALRLFEDEISSRAGMSSTRLNRFKSVAYMAFDRELCLLYSVWWNCQYNGGPQRWDEALGVYGIDRKYLKDIIEAIKQELTEKQRLGIILHRNGQGNQYLRSLCAQGGLPMKFMENPDISSSFENFLIRLIESFKEIDKDAWGQTNVVNALADTYINNSTLRESEAVLDFATEIAKAYLNDEDTFDDYDVVRNIINKIRGTINRPKKERKQQFRANWFYKIKGDHLNLSFTIEGPTEIDVKPETAEMDKLSFFAEGRFIASYYRSGDKFYLMPGSQMGRLLDRKVNNAFVDFQCSNGKEWSLINNEVPFVETPCLLQYDIRQSAFTKKLTADGNYACLIPEGWSCAKLTPSRTLLLGETSCSWVDQISLSVFEEGDLLFVNLNGEHIFLGRKSSNFSISFSPRCYSWVEESSMMLAMDVDDFSKFIHCYEGDEKCNKSKFSFRYKSEGSQNFKEYRRGPLPDGYILMRVYAPTGELVKSLSFFNINSIKYDASDKEFTLTYANGECSLLAGQEHVHSSGDKYRVEDCTTLGMSGYANIGFRLTSHSGTKSVIIHVTSPLVEACFISSDGTIVKDQSYIAQDELYQYNIVLPCRMKVSLRMWNDSECLISKEIIMPAGRFSLDLFKEDIDRFVRMSGFDDYHKYITIKISGGKQIRVRRNALTPSQTKDEQGVPYLKATRDGIYEQQQLKLFAIPIDIAEDSPYHHKNDIRMEERHPGHYYLPDEVWNGSETVKFVVVSDNNHDAGSLRPFLFDNTEDLDKDARDAIKRKSIEGTALALTNGDETAWNDMWFFIDTVIKYRLPYYSSFNAFFTISNDPDLQAALIVRIESSTIWQKYGEETIISELQRMEKELGFGFHYVPITSWKKEADRIGADYEAAVKILSAMPSLANSLGEKDEYVDKRFYALEGILESQFGAEYVLPIKFYLRGYPWPNKPEFTIKNDDGRLNKALADIEEFLAPDDCKFPPVELQPKNQWDKIGIAGIQQRLQNLAVVMPQAAAQYAHGYDMKFWRFQKDSKVNIFLRRMINYMSVYIPDVYNELFYTSLLRGPIK